ncbi:hypothetical protein CYMTET_8950 [Cymbomonas tetramitiformis]|uniref:Uncharacterized protein n=1 Tax=Cymbomonas tetramitiformis TaxID=36881 RepID=A0AAE0GSF1_9CHLO|nr:hypothetical protein CYMTET_8950 [Cymbomonas tetramitiformis]
MLTWTLMWTPWERERGVNGLGICKCELLQGGSVKLLSVCLEPLQDDVSSIPKTSKKKANETRMEKGTMMNPLANNGDIENPIADKAYSGNENSDDDDEEQGYVVGCFKYCSAHHVDQYNQTRR